MSVAGITTGRVDLLFSGEQNKKSMVFTNIKCITKLPSYLWINAASNIDGPPWLITLVKNQHFGPFVPRKCVSVDWVAPAPLGIVADSKLVCHGRMLFQKLIHHPVSMAQHNPSHCHGNREDRRWCHQMPNGPQLAGGTGAGGLLGAVVSCDMVSTPCRLNMCSPDSSQPSSFWGMWSLISGCAAGSTVGVLAHGKGPSFSSHAFGIHKNHQYQSYSPPARWGVVRFYHSCCPPPPPPPPSPPPSPPPLPPPPVFSSTMSASTSTSTSLFANFPAQCALLDLNLGPYQLSAHRWTSTWDLPSSVRTAGPQPDPFPAQVRTAGPQPGTFPAQCAPLDLNLGPSQLSAHRWTSTWDLPSSVRTAGPQRQIECQKICQIECQIECQKICQIECHRICQIECQNVCQIERWKICQIECQEKCQIECQKICQIKCQNVCQIECQKICQIICQKICQIECQMECQKICQNICQKICQVECQKICQIECQMECQKICQKICQVKCQKICQIECQIECQKICQIECEKICQ